MTTTEIQECGCRETYRRMHALAALPAHDALYHHHEGEQEMTTTKDPAPYRVTSGYAGLHPERAPRAGANILPGLDRLGVTYVYDPRPEYDD